MLALGQPGPEGVPQERELLVLMRARAFDVLAVHQPGLDRVQLQPTLGQPGRAPGPDQLRLGFAAAVHHHVIAVPFERDSRIVPGHPHVERVMHEEVGQQGRDRRALRAAPIPAHQRSVRALDRRHQPPAHIQQHPRKAGVTLDRTHQQTMVDGVEERPDVHIDHPIVLPAPFPGHSHRVMRRPARPIPEGIRVEQRLHHRFQHHARHSLRNPVGHGGHPERPDFV